MRDNKHQLIIGIMIFTIVLTIATNYYVKKETDTQLAAVQDALTKLQSETETKLLTVGTQLTNLQTKADEDKEELLSQLKETEASSKNKISALQEKVNGISVESGDLSSVISEALKGVVSVITDRGQGSGAIITANGFVVTNVHVLQGATRVAVLTYDKRVYPATVVNFTKVNDIAILKIDVQDHPYLRFGNSDKIDIGEKVVALGNPAGLGFTATEGIISQKDRVIERGSIGLLQTDAQINPGNSGGPLINKDGNIIGILRLKVQGFEGLGFAIPSIFVKQYVEESLRKDL